MKQVKSFTGEWFAGCFIIKIMFAEGGELIVVESAAKYYDKASCQEAAMKQAMESLEL